MVGWNSTRKEAQKMEILNIVKDIRDGGTRKRRSTRLYFVDDLQSDLDLYPNCCLWNFDLSMQ